jgi:hypothetical protein
MYLTKTRESIVRGKRFRVLKKFDKNQAPGIL